MRNRMKELGVVALMIFGTCPASAQKTSQEALNLQADSIEIQDRSQRAVATGNVRATQGTMTITAASATAHYTGSQLGGGAKPEMQRIDARGNVTVTRPGEVAHGDYAIYDLNKNNVVLVGNVSLKKDGNLVNGGRLSINLDNNRATLNGSAVGSTSMAPNGRVTGVFSVPKRNITNNDQP